MIEKFLIQLSCQIHSDSFSLDELPVELQSCATVEEKLHQVSQLKIYLKNKSQALRIKNQLKQMSHFHLSHFQITVLPFSQWAHRWKKGLKILKVSKNLVIRPSWLKHRKRRGETVIQIDPEMAFGTGHHPTTFMCLEWISKNASHWRKVCDVGCGSGILAIAAVKLGAQKATAIDIDLEALKAARKNIQLNQVSKKISLKKDIQEASKKKQHFDAVFSNLTARDIRTNWQDIASLTTRGGQLMLAGIEASQTHWFEPWLQKQKSWILKEGKKDGDWKGYFLEKTK